MEGMICLGSAVFILGVFFTIMWIGDLYHQLNAERERRIALAVLAARLEVELSFLRPKEGEKEGVES